MTLELLIGDVGLLECLFVVCRFQGVRLDDTDHILHHCVRLQLRTEALVHANQSVLVVNVEPTLLRSFIRGVSDVNRDSRVQASRLVLRKHIIFSREMRDRVSRHDWSPAKREFAPRFQVQNFHVST